MVINLKKMSFIIGGVLLLGSMNVYALECDEKIVQIINKQTTLAPTITLNDLQNLLGKTQARTINEHLVEWGTYGVVIRNGFFAQQVGIIPPVLQQRNTFVFTLDHLKNVLGQPTRTRSDVVYSYSWSCPSGSSLNAIFNSKGLLMELNSNLCSRSAHNGIYYCVGGLQWANTSYLLDSLANKS